MFCLCWTSTPIFAQESTLYKKIHFAYLGESLIQPGSRFGYSHEFWKKTKIKRITKKFPKGKPKTKSLAALYQVGFFTRNKLYASIPLTVSLLYTRTRARGFVAQYSLAVGYDRTFLKGETYEVNDQGEVSEQLLAGSGYLSTQFGIGFGVDFTKFSNPLPISIIYKNNIFIKHNYNNTSVPFWLTEIELTYTLNY